MLCYNEALKTFKEGKLMIRGTFISQMVEDIVIHNEASQYADVDNVDYDFIFYREAYGDLQDFYERVIDYKEEFGDCMICLNYCCPDGYPLGDMVAKIRCEYNNLSPNIIEQLNEIGFVWVGEGFDVDGVRVDLKQFVEKFNAFIKEKKHFPRYTPTIGTQEEINIERNLYHRWKRWINDKNLNNYEIEYLHKHGIETIDPELAKKDPVRPELKQLVTEYNEFIKVHDRAPGDVRKYRLELTEEEKYEYKLYHRHFRWTKVASLNEDEKKYIKDNLMRDFIRIALRKFVARFNAFVKATGRMPRSNSYGVDKEERNLYKMWGKWSHKIGNLNEYEVQYLKDNNIPIKSLDKKQSNHTSFNS